MSPASDVASELGFLLARLERQGIKPGLEATRELSSRLGSPEADLPAVLIAGTNGKGSTATLLAAMVGAAGYRTGLYTSPHLESPRERVRIGGRAVSEEELLDTLHTIVAAADHTPTYFEAMTIAAFLLFRRREVELAVLEVGLGGRLDSTNVSDPILSIVTSIALDHTDLLGDDPAQIAREKAGVFRPGRPALCGPAPLRAAAALEEVASSVGADHVRVDDESVPFTIRQTGWRSQQIEVETASERYELETSLVGAHQGNNMRLAIAAAEALRGEGWTRLDGAAVRQGARGAFWPGRQEWIERPDRKGCGVLLDAAHNPAAIASLQTSLEASGAPYELLFGALADRPAAEMLTVLQTSAKRSLLTRSASPRAWWPEALSTDVDREESIDRAVELALARQDAPLLVICGSIFVVGPVRASLVRRWPGVVVAAVECDVALDGERKSG